VRVKICGITCLEDAMAAVEAGADALGFIFVEGTPRFVTPAAVAPIVRRLPPAVTAVGVFWNHPRPHVQAVAAACGLGALQLHGDETPGDVSGHGLPVIKTIKVQPADGPAGTETLAVLAAMEAYDVAAFLLDSAARWSEGEPRHPIAWSLARAAGARRRVILSAGLTPESVARAIAAARPHAVDVNSGVEARPGRKDPLKLRRFIAAAREPA
jgi:phosphoribosylanthranilate isomerase